MKKTIVVLLCCFCFNIWAFQKVSLPKELVAIEKSYPQAHISSYYNYEIQDWIVSVNGKEMRWAEGRMLPIKNNYKVNEWRKIVDYEYVSAIPKPEDYSSQEIEELSRDRILSMQSAKPPYFLAFHDALYDGINRVATEKHIKTTVFLGKKVNCHEAIIPLLKEIEMEIYALVEKEKQTKVSPIDGTVQYFVSQISEVQGYAWREIVGTESRSFHSWGIAIDILPKGWNSKNMYWQWSSEWNKNWMLIPLSRRWMPPEQVVTVFEKHGFIWGGKWTLWDNMHFEYRPELIYLRDNK
jgi:hypothetical protein